MTSADDGSNVEDDVREHLRKWDEVAPPSTVDVVASGGSEARLRALLDNLDGSGDEDLVDRAYALLRDLRVKASVNRWRETQLSSLLDTAQELLSASASETLLEVIVRAARRLLPADVAHINLGLREDEVYRRIRASEGELTDAWRDYRSVPGYGVTGRVYETNMPYVARDYLRDDGIAHRAAADEAVASDAVATMAGVPVRRGSEVVGVLVTSWRTPTDVSDDQIDLLSSLAALGGLALESARLNDARRAALAEVEEVNAQLRSANDALTQSTALHDELIRLVVSGADMAEVCDEVSRAFGCAAAVFDHENELVASTSDGFPNWTPADPLPAHLQMARAESNQETLATIVTDMDDPGDIDQQSLERVGLVCALLLANSRRAMEGQARDENRLVADLLSGGDIAHRAWQRAAGILGPEDTDRVAIVVEPEGPEASSHRNLLLACRRWARGADALCGEWGGRILLMVPGDDPDDAARRLQTRVEKSAGHVVVGADGPFSDPEAAAGCAARAVRFCEAVRRLRTRSRRGTSASLGFAGLLLAGPDDERVREHVRSVIGPIIDYDAKRGTDLLQTLAVYLEHGGSLQEVAKRMHIHVNTAYQRLQRMSGLLGDERWQSPSSQLELFLALQLFELVGSKAGAEV